MRSAIPKQFLLLEGRPLLMHTIERFHSFDSSIEIILVLPAEHHSLWNRPGQREFFQYKSRVAAGGEERFHSVRAGTLFCDRKKSLVAIHDGVRPLVSHDTIWRCYADAEEFGTAIPFIEPADSVRIIEGDESRPCQGARCD